MKAIDLDTKFIKNAFFSGLAHLTNVIFPVLYIPIVLPIIGLEKMGIIGISTSLATFMTIIVDYGFNILGVQDIIECKGDKLSLSRSLFNILYTKLLLFLVCSLILVVLVLFLPIFKDDLHVYLYSLAIVFGQAISLAFFFQAKEQFLYNSLTIIFSRVIAIILIVYLIQISSDYSRIPLFIGVGTIFANVVAIGGLLIKGYYPSMPSYVSIAKMLKSGFLISISNVSVSVYMQGNIFFLKLFASDTIVGFYSICEKIVFGIRQLLSIFSNIIYPKLYKQYKDQKEDNKKINQYFMILYAGMLLILLILLLFPHEIIQIVARSDFQNFNINAFRLFCFVPIIVAFNIYPYLKLTIMNHIKISQAVILTGAFFSVFLNLLLGYFFQLYGIVLSIIIVELFITLALRNKYQSLRSS